MTDPLNQNVEQKDSTEQPQLKKVDIMIAGVRYSVMCPIHEEEDLRSAVYYINNFAMDIKNSAPNISQENLLVLSCLNLFEKISHQEKSANHAKNSNQQSENLLNKLIDDAESMLQNTDNKAK
ncbi:MULTISPECIES: cell division protein ZapA [Psychrobacter]|uniref:cell division protein ZapA n=1 Tax=Psychrobacter TaxID=497 RepID=UPI00146D8AE6|nr:MULTISPECIES: cell division protein ZapA [Psychrobacter]